MNLPSNIVVKDIYLRLVRSQSVFSDANPAKLENLKYKLATLRIHDVIFTTYLIDKSLYVHKSTGTLYKYFRSI